MGEMNAMTDAQKIKFHADIYYSSANLLIEEHEIIIRKIIDSECKIELTEEERGKMSLSLPAHCLYAFCSELYLKSLIVQGGNTYDRIHCLDDLYKALDEGLQEEIENEYNKVYEGNLMELLTSHRKDFQVIRYAFEGVGGARLLSFVKWLADTLKIIADKNVDKCQREQIVE